MPLPTLRSLSRAPLTIVGLALSWAAAGAPEPPAGLPTPTVAQGTPSPAADATPLPAEVLAALRRADLPPRALAAWVQPLDADRPVVAWNADLPVNPASVFKLVTTTAALDQLGPAFTWDTPVEVTGPVRGGVLQGSLVIRGTGDPKLVLERVWLLLRQVRQAGIASIEGDIVLDSGAFAAPEASPGDFDGEPWRPYNVLPDALLLNYKSVILTFTPDAEAGVARVAAEPALAGVALPPGLPLSPGACGDWRAGLKLDVAATDRWRFAGGYPASCGTRTWPVAYADPARYGARLVDALWREVGGTLRGTVHAGTAPAGALPLLAASSPPLADVIRDLNKYSNNVMAEQVFLTLALQSPSHVPGRPATPDEARAVLGRWLHERLGAGADDTVVVNGSGLARGTRVRVRTLARLLRWIEASPLAPELLSSLPVPGLDGTLRRSAATAATGRGHLKTGSMRDVQAVAGELMDAAGRRWLVVAVVNDPRAAAGRGAIDALLEWVARGARP